METSKNSSSFLKRLKESLKKKMERKNEKKRMVEDRLQLIYAINEAAKSI